ncbi:esterase family protein [Aureispira anguillae]|uniref:Esterase family protein n=1 Tax=Aureispira anguillae TaxID=2864201 RepID=A0A916DQW3_9BACT|nr:esterase family protein [Aureispira anguillae]BDS11424.1 esterase family protein [Aureispira anguillae]
MKTKSLTILALIYSTLLFGQEIDTLSFHSAAFNETRTVFVHQPDFFKYQSDSVEVPVIYLLDGQHEWFINPLLADIEYLQYTHEIPNALVVVIPHNNRNKECGIPNLATELPLDKFITVELEKELQKYHPSNFKVIMGHSFSASFALYSYYKHPEYYAAVIAHTPLDELEPLVEAFEKNKEIDKTNISISIGSIAANKDYYHRRNYDQLKTKFSSFFKSIQTFEANYSSHNAVPIVATPMLLTKIFTPFCNRYSEIAKVDKNYKLINRPKSIDKEMQEINQVSKLGEYFYPPEIPDINGIASRYIYSGYNDYAVNMYEMGIKYYPNYYEFYLSLYELLQTTAPNKAKLHLNKAEMLLKTFENNWQGKDELLKEIEQEKIKNEN